MAGGQGGEGKPQATFSTPCPEELTAEIHAEDWCERVKDHEMLSWKTSSQDTNDTSDTLSAEKSGYQYTCEILHTNMCAYVYIYTGREYIEYI